MTRFITILIACSLACAAGARAQEQDEPTNAKKKTTKKESVKESKSTSQVQSTGKPNTGKTMHGQGQNNLHANKGHVQAQEFKAQGAHHANNTHHANNGSANKKEINNANAAKLHNSNAGHKPNVEAIRAQHVNFHAQQKSQIASVNFNQNYHINGSEKWQGRNYEVFRSYHPQWHEQGWWHQHYNRVLLIGGGWYYWNAGYWYPAWGYDTRVAYYPYDGPIYVGSNATPPDRVIADVQASLQEQGYYRGEVDGLLGPLTREALSSYQSSHGIYATAAIDEPTLSSLGLG